MELKHIDIARLVVSSANMRVKGKSPDIGNILPSVRARGVLVPLIVRRVDDTDSYEIVAGKRRYHAALTVAGETGDAEPLPCAVIEAGDDAMALEASLIENVARLDPDEVTRWESFSRLVREGRTPDEVAATFGLTELQVKRTLALGNLLPRIRTLYRNDKIDAATVRHLTLASKQRQQAWLALFDDPKAYCPTGHQVKAWAFGGQSIPVSAALFDVETYSGAIVSDLFGEERYFADAAAFWTAQNEAIEQRTEAYRNAGWADIVVLGEGDGFRSWDYERCPRREGGKVYVATNRDGSVSFHEGYVTVKEARRRSKGEISPKPKRAEVTSSQQDYVDLHRHAAVRARLLNHPDIALRVAVAHIIAGSPLWSVRVEEQRAANQTVESVQHSLSEAVFDAKRRSLLAELDLDIDSPTISATYRLRGELAGLVAKLMEVDDATVLDILAVVMGETLDARSDVVDMLGIHLSIDMAEVWQADDALLDGLRDREILDAMLSEIGGESVAQANAKEPGRVKRQIVRDYLDGTNGRTKVTGWVPRWLAFPPSCYTDRGGVGSARRSNDLADNEHAGTVEPTLETELA